MFTSGFNAVRSAMPTSVKSFKSSANKIFSSSARSAKTPDSIHTSKPAPQTTYSGSTMQQLRGRMSQLPVGPRSLVGYSAHSMTKSDFQSKSASPTKVMQFNTSHRALPKQGQQLQNAYNNALKKTQLSAKDYHASSSAAAKLSETYNLEQHGMGRYGDGYQTVAHEDMKELNDAMSKHGQVFSKDRDALLKAHQEYTQYLKNPQ